jgi:hypothetical protein
MLLQGTVKQGSGEIKTQLLFNKVKHYLQENE